MMTSLPPGPSKPPQLPHHLWPLSTHLNPTSQDQPLEDGWSEDPRQLGLSSSPKQGGLGGQGQEDPPERWLSYSLTSGDCGHTIQLPGPPIIGSDHLVNSSLVTPLGFYQMAIPPLDLRSIQLEGQVLPREWALLPGEMGPIRQENLRIP